MVHALRIDSPIGLLTLVSSEERLTFLKAGAITLAPDVIVHEGPDVAPLDLASAWLAGYFRGERPDPSGLPLALSGTPFQLAVWDALRKIPYGTTTTYGELAQRIEARPGKNLARAVGNAVGRNPLPIIIPCHRVIQKNGKLGGFSLEGVPNALAVKRHLLALEGARLA